MSQDKPVAPKYSWSEDGKTVVFVNSEDFPDYKPVAAQEPDVWLVGHDGGLHMAVARTRAEAEFWQLHGLQVKGYYDHAASCARGSALEEWNTTYEEVSKNAIAELHAKITEREAEIERLNRENNELGARIGKELNIENRQQAERIKALEADRDYQIEKALEYMNRWTAEEAKLAKADAVISKVKLVLTSIAKYANAAAMRELARENVETKAIATRAKEKRRTHTLEALCTAYVDYLKSKGKQKSYRDTKSLFKVHVITAWLDYAAMPANEVTSHQIAAIIRKVREAGKERTAGMLRNYLTAAYNAARRAPFDSSMPSSLIEFEITANPAEVVPTIPVNRGSRVLSVAELKSYMAAIGEDAAGLALQVALLAGGQRVTQLLRAKVSDFDTDTDTLRLWDTKGKRTLAREHLVPMVPKAAAIARSLAAGKRDDELLFGVQSQTLGNRVSEISAKNSAPFDLRDIRRTVETQLAGMGIHKDTRAQLLSHGISGVQAAHYDRYEYFNEKRNALIAWESRLDEIANGAAGSNVVQIYSAA